MSKINVICNTSPIIGLMSIEHPQEVEEIKQCISEKKFIVYQVQNEEVVKKLYGKLHYGELEVIIGAKECAIPLPVLLIMAELVTFIIGQKPHLPLLWRTVS